MRDLRCAEIAARAGTLKFHLDRTRHQLEAARAELKAACREAKQALERERDVLKRKNAEQECELAKLRGTRARHAKARFGSKSEKKEGTGNKQGQQPGKSGHGPRAKLEEKRHDSPASQCPCCGERHVANGSHETLIMEVHVKAHARRIVRGRRGCQCPSAPAEIIAPAPLRLFANTLFGTSVRGYVLCERYACLRPLPRDGWRTRDCRWRRERSLAA